MCSIYLVLLRCLKQENAVGATYVNRERNV
jgi:hypothetical protein